MFCNQCEQTAHGVACVDVGVCGKDPDMESLQETLLYGVKGMASYAHHARRLGKTDEAVSAFIEEALFATVTNVNFSIESLFELVLECGKMNLRVMQLLDEGHRERFGEPSPATVFEGTKAGPGILVTGHDLLDLENILKQVEGTNILVYTHGEMLPAHAYPKLRNHPNLAGHYGGAWQKQKVEFGQFSGPVVATTNCVLIPWESYRGRLYTTRATAVPGCPRICDDDYSAVIEKARQCAPLAHHQTGSSQVGFHHNVILSLADKVVSAVKEGKISRFFLIGGCDGAEPGRNFYRELAERAPSDSIILTLGCGKYRIRDYNYGEVAGLPRLLDMGQCNDAYGAIQVAVALAGAFNCGVNDLPLSIVLSWFEQKAVAVLLTLLYLDVKGIRIGPAKPAFLTDNVLKILQDKYDLQLIEKDPLVQLQVLGAC